MSLDFIPSFTILRSLSMSTSLDACPFTSTAGARPNVLRFFAAYSGVHLSLVTYITVRWSMRKGYSYFSTSLCISARRSASPLSVVSIFLYLSSIGAWSFFSLSTFLMISIYYSNLVIPFVRVAEPSNHERFAEEGYFV